MTSQIFCCSLFHCCTGRTKRYLQTNTNDNGRLTVHYIAYYTAAHQINKYVDMKYLFEFKLFYFTCLLSI